MRFLPLALLLTLAPVVGLAQATPTVKQAPPPGIAVPEADRTELQGSLDALGKELEALRAAGKGDASKTSLLADVEVFHKAVRYALTYNEFFNLKEIAAAKAQLAMGMARAGELRGGKPGWPSAPGMQVRGYYSKIDGSVQPYGLVAPDDWKPGDRQPRPLYLWFHGRGDTLSEVNFLSSCLKLKRDFATPNAFELHLYGRYCNASKFAGETDAFEAMADVARHYAIDPNRIVAMGFSMGGATVWHMAVHHAGLWAAASPGAGFAETAIYAKVFDPKKEPPAPWEQTLYRCYDATICAANLQNCPVIAYSGEIDPQKQSADLMDDAATKEALKLERLIGPKTAHKYEPETKKVLAERIHEYAAKGRDPIAPHVRFVTFTLRYNQMKWLTVDALEKHWQRAEIDAHIADQAAFKVMTLGVAAFTIALPPGPSPIRKAGPVQITLDGQNLAGPAARDGWTASFRKIAGKWALAAEISSAAGPLAKRHGLQGPIDDAFMDSFIFVRPTGQPLNARVGAWVKAELDRAVEEWRRVFRGDARIKDDTAITSEDLAGANLILWGDPSSNSLLKRLLTDPGLAKRTPNFPLVWNAESVALGAKKYASADHAPILIWPNPLSPQHYVVLNSSFTFREGATTSNALQTPKLPDWAVIDLSQPPSLKWPGKVADAGFFDESWRLPAR